MVRTLGISSGAGEIAVFYKKIIFWLVMILFSVQAHSAQRTEPELFIFVSYSMPEQSLKLWAKQANRVDGQLLLRGFVENDLQKTTAKTLALFGQEPNVDISVDPEKFQKFHIQVVPAVVIAEPDLEDSDDTSVPRFNVVYGDTSLEEALERLAKTGSPEGQQRANHFLKRYRESHE